ncbi:MAG: hypothetical protein WD992_02580 [Candidatus Levyibacteriota bacterium]
MATEFERAIGWNETKLGSLVGRDITVVERGEERRGPIRRVTVSIDGERKYSLIGFRVGWVALKEAGEWKLEAEPSKPEEGISAFSMNPDYISPRRNNSTNEIHVGKAVIHAKDDNIPKPYRPTDKPSNYIP